MQSLLLEKIKSKQACLGVIGLGYVGLPLAVDMAEAGFDTIGFDVKEAKLELIKKGCSYISDVTDDSLSVVVKSQKLLATSDFSLLANCDCVCICVPTPLDVGRQPDLSFVKNAAESIKQYIHKDMLVILESTIYPGATEELVKPILEGSGLKCGTDFYLAFSPERVDPGNAQYKTKNIAKVVGGCTKESTELAAAMYAMVLDAPVYKVSSPAVAEMEKILENAYRNINIGLVNELAILCERMHISIWEVIEAAKTKPYGFQAFYPGPGLGGHCIPVDPYYLSWKAREFAFHTSMIESSMKINDKMPQYCAERAGRILNRFKKALNGSKILLLGVAYKQDVADCRESPAIKVIHELQKLGANVDFYDPFVKCFEQDGWSMAGIEALTAETIEDYDLIVITTAHSKVDYQLVQKHAKAIFDTKNVMKDISPRDNIEIL